MALDTTGVGTRLRTERRLAGLSQQELAQTSGVSISTIRALEQGRGADPTAATARRLAAGLGVQTTRLMRAESEHVWRPAVESAGMWAPVIRAVAAPLPLPDTDPPEVGDVRTLVRTVLRANRQQDYAITAAKAPAALIGTRHLIADDNPVGRALLHDLMQCLASALVEHRQFEAADRALSAAADTAPDEVTASGVVNTRCRLLLRRGRLAEAEDLALRAADDTEPRKLSRASAGEIAAWGQLHLRAAAAAGRNNRPGEASTALRIATAAAAMVGRDGPAPGDPLRRAFGPTTIARKRAEDAAVSDKPDRALSIAEAITGDTTAGHQRHRLDVAAALSALRRHPEAVDVLTEIHAAAPQWFVQQRYAGDVLRTAMKRRRTFTPQMRALAGVLQLH